MSGFPDPRIALDALDDASLRSSLLTWAEQSAPGARDDEAMQRYFNTIIPRSVFLKNLPRGASVLDLGAGNGSLAIYKDWPYPKRPDISLYGLSLEAGEMFDRYVEVAIGDFEAMDPDFGGVAFDGVLCAHFIEHIASIERTLDYVDRRLGPGGRLYLEWPHPTSKRLPGCEEFKARGLPTFTTNFFDDGTHVETWPMRDVAAALEARGFGIETFGRTYAPYLADAMRDMARRLDDVVLGTFAVWYKAGFAQYVVAAKA